jgi:hypothetical protein
MSNDEVFNKETDVVTGTEAVWTRIDQYKSKCLHTISSSDRLRIAIGKKVFVVLCR